MPGLDPAVVNALTEAGIGEPKRAELAQRWSTFTNGAQRIRETAGAYAQRGKSTGVLVRELEARAEAELARAEAHEREAADQVKAERSAAIQEAELRRLEEASGPWIAQKTDEEVEVLKAKLLSEHPEDVSLLIRRAGITAADARTMFATVLYAHYGDGEAKAEG